MISQRAGRTRYMDDRLRRLACVGVAAVLLLGVGAAFDRTSARLTDQADTIKTLEKQIVKNRQEFQRTQRNARLAAQEARALRNQLQDAGLTPKVPATPPPPVIVTPPSTTTVVPGAPGPRGDAGPMGPSGPSTTVVGNDSDNCLLFLCLRG